MPRARTSRSRSRRSAKHNKQNRAYSRHYAWRNTPSYVGSAPSRIASQNIMVKTLAQMNLEITTGTRFMGAFGISPYDFIANSAWAPYLSVWARYRVEQYDVRIYFPVMNDAYNPGSIVSYLYRDGVSADNPLRSYEQIMVEPGSIETRIGKHTMFHWRPVEPSDRDWYETSKQGTDYPGFGSFGTVCAAGLFDDLTNRPEADFQLLVLVNMRIKFATLRKAPNDPYKPDGPGETMGFEDLEVRSNRSLPRTIPAIRRR